MFHPAIHSVSHSCFSISDTPTDAASTVATAVTWTMCRRYFALPDTVCPIHTSSSSSSAFPSYTRPWDTLACCWDVKQTTNQPQLYLWGSPFLGEIFAFVTFFLFFYFFNPTIEVFTFCLHGYSCFHISNTSTDAASTTTTRTTAVT